MGLSSVVRLNDNSAQDDGGLGMGKCLPVLPCQHWKPPWRIFERTKLHPIAYLEGEGDLASRLVTPITHIIILVIPSINLLTKS